MLAAVLVSGAGLLASQWAVAADKARNAAQAEQNTQPQLPNGVQQKDLNQLDNIRGAMAAVTNDALTQGDFGKVVDKLAVENRDQMKDYKNQDFKTLDGVIAQINQDWRQKYGHNFDVSAVKDMFTDRQVIVQGVVTDPNVAAANIPVLPTGEQARLAGSREKAEPGQAAQVKAQNLKDSHGVAVMRWPSEGKLPDMNVSLIEEGRGSWRIAIPDQTSQQLHQQLQDQLTYLDRDKADWPANESEAYRIAGHRVFMALYDVNAPQADQTK
jgi:hypothetical protein